MLRLVTSATCAQLLQEELAVVDEIPNVVDDRATALDLQTQLAILARRCQCRALAQQVDHRRSLVGHVACEGHRLMPHEQKLDPVARLAALQDLGLERLDAIRGLVDQALAKLVQADEEPGHQFDRRANLESATATPVQPAAGCPS